MAVNTPTAVLRLVNAIGFIGQVIAGGFVGTSPAAAADALVFALAALAFKVVYIPKGVKKG